MNTDNANKYLNERQIYQRDVWDSKDIEHPLDCLLEDYHQEQLKLLGTADVSKRFDFDKLLQDYRQEFVNGGGYVKSDTFESGTEPYEVFEWFKKKLS